MSVKKSKAYLHRSDTKESWIWAPKRPFYESFTFWSLVYCASLLIIVGVLLFVVSIIFSKAEAHERKPLPPQTVIARSYKATVTAYTVGDGSGWYTADGTRVSFGVLACPYSLKFGTRIKIRDLYGDKVFKCHDRSATREGLFDVWVSTFKEAYSVGRRTLNVEVLK